MKGYAQTIGMLLLCFLIQKSEARALSVMTFNIRYDNSGDGVNQWKFRTKRIDQMLKHYHPEILGVQEALVNQMTDLSKMNALRGYQYTGVGRDDGRSKGEYAAIFYQTKAFSKLQSGTFWLSETPEEAGSKGWDAACVRICTWVKLKRKQDNAEFYVFNTHFDHIGVEARKHSAELIVQRIKSLVGNQPYVLMGDLNSEPEDIAYQTLVNNTNLVLKDTRNEVPLKQVTTDCTFQGFAVNGAECKLIDYIFISAAVSAMTYTIVKDHDEKNYLSDHHPVYCELNW